MKIKLVLFTTCISLISFAQVDTKTLITYTYDNRNGFGQGSATYFFDSQLLVSDSIAEFIFDRRSKNVGDSEEKLKVAFWRYINHYNLKTKGFREQRELEDGMLLTASWQQDYIWEITEITKTINGYKVIKAITQSIETDPNGDWHYGNAIAWFSPDIEISAGPARYAGLPGLIMELEYENFGGIYRIKDIEFDTKDIIRNISQGHNVDKLDVLYFIPPNKKSIEKLK